MSRYIYKLELLEGEEWIETVYDRRPTEEIDKAKDENKVFKLTITKRT